MVLRGLVKHGVLLALMIFGASATAKNLWCTGNVTGIYVDNYNDVVISGSWRNSWRKICNTNGDVDNISTIACSHWIGFITSAVNHNKQVTLMYSNVPDALECDALATCADSLKPTYVMMKSN